MDKHTLKKPEKKLDFEDFRRKTGGFSLGKNFGKSQTKILKCWQT
jgi:hypothetical protein